MDICLIEPFFAGSHKEWSEGFQKHSKHNIDILSMPGRHWKWRMHGAAVSLAAAFNKKDSLPDLIVVSDILDLSTFMALTEPKRKDIPILIYFHENQITYPWSESDRDVALKRDNHYGWINYTSALSADYVAFNSAFHRSDFLEALTAFLNQFPDGINLSTAESIKNKSLVLPLGLDLKKIDDSISPKKKNDVPHVLWNHRWEYDKNPVSFFRIMKLLKEDNLPFRLIITGESYKRKPAVFEEARNTFRDEIVHYGFVASKHEYYRLLSQADILPVTCIQEFFGISVVEAIYAGVFPLLPKRLSYPDHIDPLRHPEVFYENEASLYQKLKNIITHWGSKELPSYRKEVENYDWQKMIKIYDEKISDLVSKKTNLSRLSI